MNELGLQITAEGVLKLQGELNMHTVPAILAATQEALASRAKTQTIVDLQDIKRSDSAGLAYLTACMRMAEQHHIEIRFANVPEQMLKIARVSELDKILPL